MTCRDIDGDLIPQENIYPHPSSGQLFDRSVLSTNGKKVLYKGREIVEDGFGIVKLATRVYREPMAAVLDLDESPPASPVDAVDSVVDLDDSSDVPVARPESSMPLGGRPATNDTASKNYVPKMRDIDLSSAQKTYSIQKHPSHVEAVTKGFEDKHFQNVAAIQQKLVAASEHVRKHNYGGFDPQELLLNGALNCAPCRPTNLVYTPTLQLFSEERFHDVPEEVFEIIKPALALAEHVMLRGAPKFWVDLACGERVVDTVVTSNLGSRAEHLLPVVEVTPEMMASTIAKLQKMGSKLTYRFTPLPTAYGCTAVLNMVPMHRPDGGYLARGACWPSNEALRHNGTRPADPWESNVVIDFNHNFYAAAKLFATQKFPDVAAQLRFTFFFAVNLVHELAHAFESKCGAGAYYDEICKDRERAAQTGDLSPAYLTRWAEARYKGYDFVELGAVFEYETFGGRIHPVNCDYSSRYGIDISLGDGNGLISNAGRHEIQQGRPYARAVPMGFIEEIFQQSYWTDGAKLLGVMVPVYGPKSYIIHSTSTTSWRQHVTGMDTADITDGLPSAFGHFGVDDNPRAPKRHKVEETRSTKAVRQRKPQGRSGRLLQSQILRKADRRGRRYGGIKSILVTRSADEAAKVAASSKLEAEQVNAAREYRPPSPHQGAIDDQFGYVNDDSIAGIDERLEPTSDSYDPLLKPAIELTIADKWLLLEEYASIVHSWDSSYFLSRRMMMKSNRDLVPIAAQLIPSSEFWNWNDAACKHLKTLRTMKPERTMAHLRAHKAQARTEKLEKWRVLRDMEELIVRTGQSRISFMRSMVTELPIVVNNRVMTTENFDQEFRPLLLKLREQEKAERLTKVKEDALARKAASQTSPVSTPPEHDKGNRREPAGQDDTKITDYFVNLQDFLPVYHKSKSLRTDRLKSYSIKATLDRKRKVEAAAVSTTE